MKEETKPIAFEYTNATLYGDGRIAGLPVYKNGEVIISCWKIPVWRRIKLLFSGKVFLCTMGQKQSPLFIETEIIFEDGKKLK